MRSQDLLVLGQNPQRCGVGRQLVVRIAEVGVFLIFQRPHRVELSFHLVLDFGVDFVEECSLI